MTTEPNYPKLGGWTKQTCSATVLEISVTGLKSSYEQSSAPSGDSRGESVPCLWQLLVVMGVSWFGDTSLPSLPMFSQCLLLLCASNLLLLFSLRTFVITFLPYPDNLASSSIFRILNLITVSFFFQIRSYLQVSGIKISCIGVWGLERGYAKYFAYHNHPTLIFLLY